MSKLWGGRFHGKTDKAVEEYTSSIIIDHRLAKYDCLCSIAHVKMLGECRIIPKSDSAKITKGLKSILARIESGKFKFDPKAEDIHSNIQDELAKRVGSVAGKLQTARSRNDQVATDLRLYCKDCMVSLMADLSAVEKSLENLAGKNKGLEVPGYTHTQRAQVVGIERYLGAYIEMLKRDRQRFAQSYAACDVMPLGSCASAGTTLPIDRKYTAKILGFSRISKNSMDAVSDRDFVLEILSAASIAGMHLSRLAEDLVLWSTQEYGYIEIDDAFCTGSSMMPHKKNPDVAELVRGKSSKSLGALVELLCMMKGLPLTYNRDMQNDKEPLFIALDELKRSLKITALLLNKVRFNRKRLKEATSDEEMYATDVAEYLVEKGVAFKDAHHSVGTLVKLARSKGVRISGLPLDQMKRIDPKLDRGVYRLLSGGAKRRT